MRVTKRHWSGRIKGACLIGGVSIGSFIFGVVMTPSEVTVERPEVVATVTATPEPAPTVTVTAEPEPAVTVTATPEVVVDTTSQDVVQSSGACDQAIKAAQKIADDVSPVVKAMGEQRQLMSNARLAINGSNYISMGEVMRDQTELENSFAGNYTRLASTYNTLETALEECK